MRPYVHTAAEQPRDGGTNISGRYIVVLRVDTDTQSERINYGVDKQKHSFAMLIFSAENHVWTRTRTSHLFLPSRLGLLCEAVCVPIGAPRTHGHRPFPVPHYLPAGSATHHGGRKPGTFSLRTRETGSPGIPAGEVPQPDGYTGVPEAATIRTAFGSPPPVGPKCLH